MAITPPWALHVGTPNCFNRPTAIGMATTVTAGDTSVAFTALDGQVVSFNEYSTNATFTRTDRNNDGGAAGDRRRVTGVNVSTLAGEIASSHSASTEASFEITGTVTFDTPRDPAQSSPY
jgi:hypothetical protein